MNNPDKPHYRTMIELFYVDVGSLLHKKLPSINAYNVSIPNSHILRDSFSVKYENTFGRMVLGWIN